MQDTHQAMIDYAIGEEKMLTIRTHSYLSRERDYIDEVLKNYLSDVNLIRLLNQVSYCVHELAGNAYKANTKRVYFQEKGLIINDPSDYIKGMRTFKSETVEKVLFFNTLQKEASLYVRFDFKKVEDYLIIRVRNNISLTPEEQDRINHKMEVARSYNSLVEAYSTVEDSSEGAGLGIVMMVIMLKSLGFGEDCLHIYTHEGETVGELVLDTLVEVDESAMEGIA